MRFLVLSFDVNGVDLDWKMPILFELIKKGYPVKVVIPRVRQINAIGHNIHLLRLKGLEIIFRDSFMGNSLLIKTLNFICERIKVKTINKILFFIYDRLIIKLKFSKVSKRIDTFLSGFDVVMAGNYPGIPVDPIERFFYECSKQSKSLFVGTPIVATSNWYQDVVFPFDLFLVSSKDEMKMINRKKLHSNTKFLGYPGFDLNYLKEVTNLEKVGLSLKGEKKIALLMLNNDRNPFFHELNQLSEAKKIIRALLDEKYEVIVKPHPRSFDIAINELKKMGNNLFIVYKGSTEAILPNIDLAISFTSSTILKLVAYKIPVIHYLPNSFFDSQHLHLASNRPHIRLYFKSIDQKEMWLDKYSLRVGTLKKFKESLKNIPDQGIYSKNIQDVFEPDNSADKIINLILNES